MNPLIQYCSTRPLLAGAATALLLHGALLAGLSQIPTRGERLLASGATPHYSYYAEAAGALTQQTGRHDRLARLAQRWLHHGGQRAPGQGRV